MPCRRGSSFGKGREAIRFRPRSEHRPSSLPDRIRAGLRDLEAKRKLTRPRPELDRVIAICLEKCDLLGTGRWVGQQYEGCPRFGRPCDGAFCKWIDSLADAGTWCEQWG